MKQVLWGTALGTLILAGMLGVNWLSLQSKPEVSAAASAQGPQSPVRRCMNLGGALEANYEGEWGYVIRRKDFTTLKQAGFDTLRVPVKFSKYTDTQAPYAIDRDFLSRIDELVDWALLEGLQIIIDVHHYDELMQNPDAHEPRLEAIWDQLAHHYQKAPDALMFELINEPHSQLGIERTDALNARLISRIRKDNPSRWIVIGSAGWGNYDALLQSKPPRGDRLIATFHYYDPFELTHQGATWMDPVYPEGAQWRGTKDEHAAIAADFDQVSTWQRTTGLPILLGEFGAYTKADERSRAEWTNGVRRAAEARGFGWCYWEWATGFKAYDVKQERWLHTMRRALTAP